MGVNPELLDRLSAVEERIATAADKVGRPRDEIRLIAITKGFGADVARAALDAGLKDLGENRAQEFRQKVGLLGDEPRWHFVGHLQTNKARHVVGAAVLIHSVDRYGLAEAISGIAVRRDVTQAVLIEVNVSGEASKHGVEPAKALHLAREVEDLDGVEVAGVMTMAPYGASTDDSREVFATARELRDRLVKEIPTATHLSMGMSDDFEAAIHEGATMVRLGRTLFGERPR